MTFKRIKTVGGHKYEYLVENVREDGKVKQKIVKYLGRVDKQTDNTQSLSIPYGLYYFAQDNCQYCNSEIEAVDFFNTVSRILEIDLPKVQYINISKEKIPVPISFSGVPTVIECNKKGVFVGPLINVFGESWLSWRVGSDKMRYYIDKYSEEQNFTKKEEIKQHIREGKKYRELYTMYGKRELIKECQNEVKEEKCKNGICPI